MAVVTGEDLVAAVAAESDGDMLPRQLRDQVSRNLRRVGKRLVENRRKLGNDRQAVGGLDDELGVIGAEMGGHGPGMRGLIIIGLTVADRKGPRPTTAMVLHHGYNRRGIDSAGK